MIMVELTYVLIKGGIVYSDVNGFFYSPGQVLVLNHIWDKNLLNTPGLK